MIGSGLRKRAASTSASSWVLSPISPSATTAVETRKASMGTGAGGVVVAGCRQRSAAPGVDPRGAEGGRRTARPAPAGDLRRRAGSNYRFAGNLSVTLHPNRVRTSPVVRR